MLERLNAFLAEAAAGARERFGGRITYASGPWEFVDWSPFDIVGVDAYRADYNAAVFREEVRAHAKHGKPVAVTEFGTCAYRDAGQRGGMAWTVPEGAVRDEGEQVRYFTDCSTSSRRRAWTARSGSPSPDTRGRATSTSAPTASSR